MGSGADRKENHPGGVAVEPLDHANGGRELRAKGVGEEFGQSRIKRPLITCRRRLRLDPRRFIQGNDVSITIEDSSIADGVGFKGKPIAIYRNFFTALDTARTTAHPSARDMYAANIDNFSCSASVTTRRTAGATFDPDAARHRPQAR